MLPQFNGFDGGLFSGRYSAHGLAIEVELSVEDGLYDERPQDAVERRRFGLILPYDKRTGFGCSVFIAKSQFRRLPASSLTDDRIILISTHQVRDMENLIGPVIIMDEGRIIFQQPVHRIAESLAVELVHEAPDASRVLYSERTLGGFVVVRPRDGGYDGRIDLETLFNAVVASRDAFHRLFEEGDRDRSSEWEGNSGAVEDVAAVAGFVVLASALSALGDHEPDHHMGFYMAVLYVGGYLVTSRAFRDLHDEAQCYAWVTMPGSQIDKFAARLLLTSIGYALGSLAHTAFAAVRLFFWALPAPLCWVIAYLRFRETEV